LNDVNTFHRCKSICLLPSSLLADVLCWEFIDNQYTIEGTSLHERVHTVGEGHREETWQLRAVWLKSERYQLIGKSDLIESADSQVYPVEYKR